MIPIDSVNSASLETFHWKRDKGFDFVFRSVETKRFISYGATRIENDACCYVSALMSFSSISYYSSGRHGDLIQLEFVKTLIYFKAYVLQDCWCCCLFIYFLIRIMFCGVERNTEMSLRFYFYTCDPLMQTRIHPYKFLLYAETVVLVTFSIHFLIPDCTLSG